MRRIAIVLAAMALAGNFLYIFDAPIEDGGNGHGVQHDLNDGDGGLIVSNITTLQVPEMKIGDQARYDYDLFAQMFWENKTSGEWGRYTFTGEGELLNYVEDLQEVEDGFQITHNALKTSYETRASFTLKIEGSDVDTATIPGNLNLQRSQFTNVFDKHPLKALNKGDLAVENIGSVFGKGGSLPMDLSYKANLKTYPDPVEDPIPNLDNAIYGMGQVLTLNSRGTFEGEPVYGEEHRNYNWTVEGAYDLLGHDSFKINVSSDIWGFLYFHREFYIANDYPFPIKGYTRTNSSYYGKNESFYIILETHQQIKDQEGAVRRGTHDIPWGDTSGNNDYVDRHPAGEFDRWKYVPSDGSDVDRSSFNYFTINDAVDYARENSEGLQDFLNEYEPKGMVLVEDSVWNMSTEDKLGRNTTYWWNLTFAHVYDMDEMEEYYDTHGDFPEWRYRLLVARSVEESRTGDTEISTFISKDKGDDYHGPRQVRWSDGVHEETLQLENEVVTLTHAEKILKIDDDVKENCFKNNKLIEGEDFYYGVVGVSEDNNPGLILIQQLTGIKTPTAYNAYGIQKDTVWTGGSTFSAALDSNTGQMLYVTSVEGSELASLFG